MGSRPGPAKRSAVWLILQGHCLFSVVVLEKALVFELPHGLVAFLQPTHLQSAFLS